MSDNIQIPSIVTPIRIGDFILYAYAYRALTKSESKIALHQYLKQYHLKSVPKTGSGKVITIFGANPEDCL